MSVTIDHLEVGDDPEAWTGAGFAVSAGGVCRLGSVAVRLIGREAGPGIRSWGLTGVDPGVTAVDGITTTPVTQPAADRAPADHPNGAIGIDHAVLLTPDRERTVAALEGIGLDVRRTRDAGDTYGMPMTQTFFRLGEVILEVISPIETTDRHSPCRFYGLALDAADIDALPARYDEHLGRIKDAVQTGRRITTLRHKDLGLSVAVAFMTPDPDAAAAP